MEAELDFRTDFRIAGTVIAAPIGFLLYRKTFQKKGKTFRRK